MIKKNELCLSVCHECWGIATKENDPLDKDRWVKHTDLEISVAG